MLSSWLNFISPPFCVNCKRPGNYFCQDCMGQIYFIKDQTCPQCQLPSADGLTHPSCLQPNCLDGLQSMAYYQGSLRKLIHHFKYGNLPVKKLNTVLAELLQLYFTPEEEYFEPGTLLTPVPLHWWRKNKRGFNQALEIAQVLSRLWQLPLCPNLLKRTRYNLPQSRLRSKARAQNVQGLFALNPKNQGKVKNQQVVLVDDVYTTGATIRECARVLKTEGQANKVFAVTLAINQPNQR